MAIHLGLATIVKTPELELEKEESDKLAAAAVNVAGFYNIEASEKALAWTNLAVVGFMTYGPRVFAMRLRWQTERDEAATAREARNAASIVAPHLRSAI